MSAPINLSTQTTQNPISGTGTVSPVVSGGGAGPRGINLVFSGGGAVSQAATGGGGGGSINWWMLGALFLGVAGLMFWLTRRKGGA